MITFYLFIILTIFQASQGRSNPRFSTTLFCIEHDGGIFPDPATEYTTCATFIFCINTNGLIYGRVETCPDDKNIFDPYKSSCVSSGQYTCPQLPTTAESTTESTSESTTTVSTESTTVDALVFCTNLKAGRYADPETARTTCKGYIHCYLSEGVMIGQRRTCGEAAIFDPRIQLCVVSGYTCPSRF